jgi:GPH family glycoside/pentoside/hexuronide:cation symporter
MIAPFWCQPMIDRAEPVAAAAAAAALVPQEGLPRLSHGMSAAWGSGSFCQTLVIYAFGVLYFRYLTDSVGIGAALVGSMIAASKMFDAAINPVIGWLTDRIETPMGRRRPWMLAAGGIMAASLVAGFSIPPDAALIVRVLRAGLGLLLFSVGYSLFAIPWLAMPPEMSGDPDVRTRMMVWRVGFSSLAQGAAALVGPMLLVALGSGWIMGLICLAAALGTVRATRGAPQRAVEAGERLPILGQLAAMARNRPFRTLVGVKICIYFGLGVNAAAMALLTRWLLRVSDYWLGSFTLISTLSLVASQPLWLWLSRRYGRAGGLGIALAAHSLGQLSLAFNHGSVALLLVQAVALGSASGGVFMLSQALLPDVIDHDNRTSGQRRAGAFAGVVALLETGSSALAIFLMGILLSLAGYIEGATTATVQPDSALMAIRVCASILPTLAEGLAIFLLTRFKLEGGSR